MENKILSQFDEAKSIWVVSFYGEYDIFNAEDIKTTLLKLIDTKKADMVFDFSALAYLDSTAIGALVVILKAVNAYNGKIEVKNIKPNLHKLFKITNLDQLFIIKIEGDINV